MAIFGFCCSLGCLSLYFVVPVNILIKAMAVHLCWHMAQAWIMFFCWVSYLVERMRDYTSLLASGIGVASFVAWSSEVFVHLYKSCLVPLSFVGFSLGMWNLISSTWYKSEQLVGEATEKCALGRMIPGWQGVWEDLSRCAGQLSPLIAYNFMAEETCNPIEMENHLTERWLAYPIGSYWFIALMWGLPCDWASFQLHHRSKRRRASGYENASG